MKRISIRFAVVFPFVLVFIIISLVLLVSLNRSYKSLSTKQANTVIDLMSSQVYSQVSELLSKPKSMGEVFATNFSKNYYYETDDYQEIEALLYEIIKKIHNEIPQITTIGYGDERGNMIGVRSNTDGTYTLMVQDEATDDKLLIFNGDQREDGVLVEIEDYDPRTRPWYVPVKENPVSQWSQIYINMDEINDATISSLIPVMNYDHNAFQGVVSVDVSLRLINAFLRDIASDSSATIYIYDHNNHLISHSATDPIYHVSEAEVNFIPIHKSENPIIATSAQYIEEDMSGVLDDFQVDNMRYYMKTVELLGDTIGWNLVVVVPENTLVGNIKQEFGSITLLFFVMAFIAIVMGGVLLTFFTSSIVRIANEFNDTKVTESEIVYLKEPNINFYETDIVVSSFNDLLKKLQNNMVMLLETEKDLKEMTEQENERLEEQVAIKTKELANAMDELVDKEKMAALGSLVSGISHEINTPLGVAISAISHLESLINRDVEAIRNGEFSLEEFDGFISTIEESVDIASRNLGNAKDLVNSFKRISTEQGSAILEDFDPMVYIEFTVKSLYHELKINRVKVSLDQEAHFMIFGSPGNFSQIITNLMMNSIHHGFIDHSNNEIQIELKNDGDYMELEFSDNGIGIPEEHIHHIFEPFYTTRRGDGGSGLGLNIVHNMMYNHFEGTIKVMNLDSGGVKFILRFPQRT